MRRRSSPASAGTLHYEELASNGPRGRAAGAARRPGRSSRTSSRPGGPRRGAGADALVPQEAVDEGILRDVHDYLFDVEFSARPSAPERIQRRSGGVRWRRWSRAREAAHVVVAHSLGTVIAYDCLKRVDGARPSTG